MDYFHCGPLRFEKINQIRTFNIKKKKTLVVLTKITNNNNNNNDNGNNNNIKY